MKVKFAIAVLACVLLGCNQNSQNSNKTQNGNSVQNSNQSNGSTIVKAAPTPFQGKVNDILVKEFGDWKQYTGNPSMDDKLRADAEKMKKDNKASDVATIQYGNDATRAIIALTVFNFPTIEDATKALKPYQEAKEVDSQTNKRTVRQEPKMVDGQKVGDKVVIEAYMNSSPLAKRTIWTNGSLLFIADAAGMTNFDSFPSFEKDFIY